MSKGVIDFALMDRSKVAVLCLNPIHIRQMVTQLEDQGKKVKIETSLTSFFSYLETSTPGFILVSRSVKTGMGNQLAGFLQRKFKVPVLTFSEVIEVPDEKQSAQPQGTTEFVGSAVPEILHISERARPEEILSKIENFQMTYQEQINRRSRSDLTRAERMTNARIAFCESFVSLMKAEKIIEWQAERKLRAYSFLLKSENFQGLSILATEKIISASDLATLQEKARIHLELHLQEKVELEIREISQSLSWDQFQDTVSDFDQITSGELLDGQGLMAAVHIAEAEARSEDIYESKTGFHVPLEKWFTSQSLVFKLYLWLERSQKKILYVRPGTRLLPKSLERFQGKGLKSVLIDKEDLHVYQILRGLNKAA